MVPVALVIFAGVLAVTILVLVLARSASLEYDELWQRLHRPGAETLAYDVPTGRDPVDLVIALDRAGYTAVADTEHGARRVLVQCRGSKAVSRAGVRAVLESVVASGDTRVRFVDEQ